MIMIATTTKSAQQVVVCLPGKILSIYFLQYRLETFSKIIKQTLIDSLLLMDKVTTFPETFLMIAGSYVGGPFSLEARVPLPLELLEQDSIGKCFFRKHRKDL